MAVESSSINTDQSQELEDSTSCCICTEIYKCPKLLPCGHTFCVNCIQETGLKTSKGPGDEMPCPMCRREFKIPSDGFTGLQNNYYVEGLIRVAQILNPSDALFTACDACLEESREEAVKEVPRAELYCCDCKQKLCEECCKHHRKLKLTKSHRLISITEQLPAGEDLSQSMVTNYCDLHREEDLKIFCRACNTCVCYICFTEHHEGHKGTHVAKAAAEFRKEITSYVQATKTFISQVEMKKPEIAKLRQYVDNELVNLESDVTSRRDYLTQVVNKQAKELLEELSSIKHSIIKEIHIETDNIDAQLVRLESYNSYCHKIMSKGSACDICWSVGDLFIRVNELQEESQSLAERQLRPMSLCFIETNFEERDECNLLGHLKGCLKEEENWQGSLNKPSSDVRDIQTGSTNSGNSERLDDLETEGRSKDTCTMKSSENLTQPAIYPDLSTNSGNSEGLDDLETDGRSKDTMKSSENLTQPAIHPDVSPLKTDVHSPKRQRKLVEKSQEEMSRAKDDLLDAIKSNRSTNHGFEITANKKSRLDVPMHAEPTRTVQWNPAPAAFSQAGMSVHAILNESLYSLRLSLSDSVTIEVKCGDLTTMHDLDVVVSYVNKQLDIDGPLSDKIMSVAGPNVQTELLRHKQPQSFLHTGRLLHTSAGNLRGVKAILHVVRPQYHESPLRDQRSKDALRQVLYNCLSYTNDVLGLKSIGLPPFGFGWYGPQMVVDSLLDAVETFASTVVSDYPSTAAHLNYIQLVSKESNRIGQMIQCIKQRLGGH